MGIRRALSRQGSVAIDGRTAYVSGAASGIGRAMALRLDVRDRQAQLAFAAEVAQWAPQPLGLVFNHAGVTSSQSVAEAAAFLPILLQQNSGMIVNTSSVFGLVGMPHQSAYCARRSSPSAAIARTTPESAAEIIPAGAKAGKSRILVGPDAYLFDALARLMPSRYFDVFAALESAVQRRAERGAGPPPVT